MFKETVYNPHGSSSTTFTVFLELFFSPLYLESTLHSFPLPFSFTTTGDWDKVMNNLHSGVGMTSYGTYNFTFIK